MITAVDTNVLLDVLIPNARYVDSSLAALVKAHGEGDLVICETVWGELASQFNEQGEIEAFLRDAGIRLVPATGLSLFAAGVAWRAYCRRRREGLHCAVCGEVQRGVECAHCGEPLRGRQHIISDFLIGAHALHLADRLLSRDRGFYATYFADLVLLG